MKRRTIKSITAAFLLFITACGGTASPGPATKEIADSITAGVEFSSLSEKSASDLEYYIPLDTAAIDEVSFYICGSGAYPDELLIIKFKNTDDKDAALSLISERVGEKIDTFSSYAPDEMYKLEGELIKSKNEYIMLCVSADNAKAFDIFEGFFR